MTDQTKIRILTVDDHPLFCEGLAAVIATQPDMELIGQAADAREGIRLYRQLRPDITLMDVRLPDMSGIDALSAIRSDFVNARIVMLSTFQGDVEIHRALEAGARGFLLKSALPQELIGAIRHVAAGKKFVPADVATKLTEYLTNDTLTPREIEVLQLVAAGNSNRDIAMLLSISEVTVKVHVKHVMEKLEANDRTEAVVMGFRRGIIPL